MNAALRCVLLALVMAPGLPALAGPRDAVAVLNRCGKPLRGDDTVLDDSVAGGHRVLKYERGYLYFDKVAMDGWTFTHGSHGKREDLDATQMAAYLPCLSQALADSASSEPIQPVSSLSRMGTSVKAEYKELILWVGGLLVAFGAVLYGLSRRKSGEEYDDA